MNADSDMPPLIGGCVVIFAIKREAFVVCKDATKALQGVAHARFYSILGDALLLCDLCKAHAFEVSEKKDFTLFFGEGLEGLQEFLSELSPHRFLCGACRIDILDEIDAGEVVAVIVDIVVERVALAVSHTAGFIDA